MNVRCSVCVDYLNQARKPARKAKTVVSLLRDEWHHICLHIGPKSKRVTFQVEGIIAKIYERFIEEGKATIELHLPGGSYANVLVSDADVGELKKLVGALKKIKDDPIAAAELDLDPGGEEAVEAPM